MTEVVRVADESEEYGNFRVPQFKVKVEGAGLPQDVLRDVTQVVYRDNIKEIDSFELTVNNWDADAENFKYVGAERSDNLNSNANYRLFEPANKAFEIQMGYKEQRLRTMIKGKCTTLEPNFPNTSGTTLSGRGLNVLHELRRKQYTDNYSHKKPSQIAREISQKNDPQTHQKRFPIPIDIDSAALSRETEIEYLTQENQYDIDFLLNLARRVGYVVYVRPGDRSSQDRLYFGASTGDAPQPLRDVTYILKRGVSIIDFKPTLNAANQLKSVTVQGYGRNGTIKGQATINDSFITINRDLLPILRACTPREERVVSEPVPSQAEAERRARAILMERYKQFVTATGTTLGLPDLRAGMQLKIEGFGCRFSGTYFITESTHSINDSGYITRFKARREDTGS